jgi:hypothetical protein
MTEGVKAPISEIRPDPHRTVVDSKYCRGGAFSLDDTARDALPADLVPDGSICVDPSSGVASVVKGGSWEPLADKISVGDLKDVALGSPSDNDYLAWKASSSEFLPRSMNLSRCDDAEVSSPADGQILTYVATNSQFENVTHTLQRISNVEITFDSEGQVLRRHNDGKWKNHTPVLSDNSDVETAGVSDGQVLAWSTANGQFEPSTVGGASTLDDLTDTDLSATLAPFRVLQVNGTASDWVDGVHVNTVVPVTLGTGYDSAGGYRLGDMTTVANRAIMARAIDVSVGAAKWLSLSTGPTVYNVAKPVSPGVYIAEFETIQAAVTKAESDITLGYTDRALIRVGAGVFTEDVTVTKGTIALVGSGGRSSGALGKPTTVIDGTLTISALGQAGDLRIADIAIIGASGETFYASQLSSGLLVVERCYIAVLESTGTYGVRLGNSFAADRVVFSECDVYRDSKATAYAFYDQGAEDLLEVANCTIETDAGARCAMIQSPIFLASDTNIYGATNYGLYCSSNTVRYNGGRILSATSVAARFGNSATDSRVEVDGVEFEGNSASYFAVETYSNTYLTDCAIYAIDGDGIEQQSTANELRVKGCVIDAPSGRGIESAGPVWLQGSEIYCSSDGVEASATTTGAVYAEGSRVESTSGTCLSGYLAVEATGCHLESSSGAGTYVGNGGYYRLTGCYVKGTAGASAAYGLESYITGCEIIATTTYAARAPSGGLIITGSRLKGATGTNDSAVSAYGSSNIEITHSHLEGWTGLYFSSNSTTHTLLLDGVTMNTSNYAVFMAYTGITVTVTHGRVTYVQTNSNRYYNVDVGDLTDITSTAPSFV